MPAAAHSIETVVIVILENRSFDHVLGYLSRESGRTDINGLGDDAWCAAHANVGPAGRWPPYPTTRMDIPDPPHEREDMAVQIGSAPGSPGPMQGFVASYAR